MLTSLRRIFAIMKKELMQLRRDRVTFGMIIMIPLIQLVLFGYSINTKIRDIPVGVVDYSGSALGRVLVSVVEATGVVTFSESFTSLPSAEKALRDGSVRAVLILPADLSQRLVRSPSIGKGLPPSTMQETSRPVAQWIVDGTDTMVAGAVQGLRSMPLTELFHQPPNRNTATFEVALFYNPEQRSAVNTVPGLVGIILTMTMILFTSAAIVREHERGNMEMLITTPVRSLELMIGKITPYIFIGLIQASIILGLGYLLFHVHFWGNLLNLFLGTLLFIGACLSVGLVLSTLATTQLQAMQMMVFILIPSILLSGFMFPYEGMPVEAQYIAEGLPATHFMRIVRGVTLRDATLAEMPYDVLWLAGFFVVGLAVAAIRFKKRLD
ncbi:MAG: ABC transporter permease [Pseudomonadota bacterium]